MHTTVFRHKASREHADMLALLEEGRVGRAVATLGDHIARTRQFQAGVTWSHGRARRRDYRFRRDGGLLEAAPPN
jgi:DNA-binding GntR family transcriptional regulator